MKNTLIKKLISCFISLALIFCALPKCECKGLADRFFGAINHLMGKGSEENNESSDIEDGDENEFNFIKSNSADDNFFYSGNWLLYGGILFIVISITGMIITLKPKERKKRRARKAARR